jgi:hypothetical protein
LKDKVHPKWSLDEDVLVVISMGGRMWEKFSIISSLCHVRACSSNRLIESCALSFFFSSAMEGFLGARAIVLKRDKIKTQLAILGPRRGHALKNDQEQPIMIPLIQIIFVTK